MIDSSSPSKNVSSKSGSGLTVGARRRVSMLRWGFAAVLVCFGILGGVEYSSSLRGSERVFLTTLWWCIGAFAATVIIVDRFIAAPTADGGIWILFSSATAFAGMLLLLAAGHSSYSRVAAATTFVLTTLWLLVGARYLLRRQVLRLGVPEEAVVQLLAQAVNALEWRGTRLRAELMHTRDMRKLLDFDGVVIDRYSLKDDALARMITQLKLGGSRIYSADHVHELLSGRLSLQHIEDNFLDDTSGKIIYDVLKRLLDIVGAGAILLMGIVPMALCAIAIRLGSDGPILFRQDRIGRGGRVFQMLKFRSMQITMLTDSSDSAGIVTSHQPMRVTRVGKLLRRSRLDELPQLFNVLNGTMSLIGPRPEWTETAREFYERIPHYPYRHLVRPGITGWAQIHQGHVTGLDQATIKLELDLYYVKHMSFPLDLLIGVKTVWTVLTGFGAR